MPIVSGRTRNCVRRRHVLHERDRVRASASWEPGMVVQAILSDSEGWGRTLPCAALCAAPSHHPKNRLPPWPPAQAKPCRSVEKSPYLRILATI